MAMMGPSGCGKTTLMRTIFEAAKDQYHHVTGGQVTLNGGQEDTRSRWLSFLKKMPNILKGGTQVNIVWPQFILVQGLRPY
jgi:ABC-type multidrug transport system ATPase subunit